MVTFIAFLILLVLRGLFNLDFFPILIVYLAVRETTGSTVFWSAASGFIDDCLFYPHFLNFFSYTAIGGLSLFLKRFFAFEEEDLVLILVLIMTPVSILLMALGMKFFYGAAYPNLIFSVIWKTALNVFITFLLNFFYWRNR